MQKPTIQVARSFHSLLPHSRTRSSSLRFRRHHRSQQAQKVLSAPSSRHVSASTVSTATATTNGSTSSTAQNEQNGTIAIPANNAQITSDEELSSILRQFPDGIDYAFGYGSMVLSQGKATSSTDDDSPPSKIINTKSMIDVIFSVNDPRSWHEQNLRQHPEHYSSFSRAGGAEFVTWMQTRFGAKIFFHPFIDNRRKPTSGDIGDNIGGNDSNDGHSPNTSTSQLKYGVVGTNDLLRDLTQWDHLYLAGRMHKPIVSICQRSDEILEAQKINLQSAVCASLLLLSGGHPRSQFPSSSQIMEAGAGAEAEADEREAPTAVTTPRLYDTIASLSYTGDFRMETGAEDPNKLRKLVHTPGMLELWERTYQEPLENLEKMGLLSVVEMTGGNKDDATTETANLISTSVRVLELDLCDYSTRKALMNNLPSTLQKYSENIIGIPKTAIVNHDRSSKHMVDDQSMTRGREILRRELANIVAPAARSQSIKGFFSAGVVKSWRYAMAKFAKGRLKK